MTAMVRAVKVLDPELKKQAKSQGYKENDIVFVQTAKCGYKPFYKLTKINGSIVEFLKNNGVVVKKWAFI